MFRASFVLFLIVAVATFSLSVKTAEASFWTGFFTILAGIITIALVILTGGSALAFLGLCPVCGVVTSFGGLSAATITGGVACAEGLICGGTPENRLAIITPPVGTCASDVGIRFYNAEPGASHPDDQLMIYRFSRSQNSIDPDWRDYKLARWMSGTDGAAVQNGLGRGFLDAAPQFTENRALEFYELESGAYANYFAPGAGAEPLRVVRYGDVCSALGECRILDQSAPADSYALYAAKVLRDYPRTVRAQVVRYPIAASGARAPYVRYNDGEIPLQRSGGNYYVEWNGRRFSGSSVIDIPDGALSGLPVRYPIVNGKAKFNGGELPAQFNCGGTAYAPQNGALVIPLGALQNCNAVSYKVIDPFSEESRFNIEARRQSDALINIFNIRYPFIAWNGGMMRVTKYTGGLGPHFGAYYLDKPGVPRMSSERVGQAEVFRLPEFYLDGAAVQYRQYDISIPANYNSGSVIYPYPSYASAIMNDESPNVISLENKFLTAAQGAPATLPYFNVGAYEDCKDEHEQSECRRMAGAWFRPGTLFAGPFAIGVSDPAQCGLTSDPAVAASVVQRGCNFVTLFVGARNADTYDVLRNGVVIASNIPAAQQEFNDTGLSSAANYSYRVIARRGTRSAFAEAAAVTTACGNAPAASASLLDAQCNALRLGAQTQNAQSYDMVRDGVTLAVNIPVSEREYIDSGLAEQTSYQYVVRARGGGQMVDSAPLQAATLDCTPDPSATIAMGGAAQCNAVALSIDAQHADSYDIERNGAVIASGISATQTAYRDESVMEQTAYQYRAIAHRGAQSAVSNAIETQTPPCVVLPPMSASVQVVGSDCGATRLSITTENADSYDVERNGVIVAGALPAAQTTYNDTGLNRSTDYTYRVIAHGSNNRTVASAPASGRTTCVPQCSFAANPTSIVRGEQSTLGWSCARVDACELNGATAATPNGTRIVAPRVTTTYTLRCANADGSTTTQTTVNVVQPGLQEVPP